MVTAGKIFKLSKDIGLRQISKKLEGYRKEEIFEQGDQKINLLKEIQDCSLSKEGLGGNFSEDVVLSVNQRGKLISVPRTRRAPFLFSTHKNRTLLTILEKKPVANNIANQLTKILKTEGGEIVEGRITSDTLRGFHESNPEGTKIILFEDIDIPNVEKLSLYGSNLANTTLYNEYCKHGRIWYVVVTSKRYGNVVGLTGDCVVTVFNKIDEKDYLKYVMQEIFSLVT
jgi:hypothetical protein